MGTKYRIGVGICTVDCKVHQVVPISLFNCMSGHDWSDYQFKVFTKDSIYIDVNRNDVAAQFLNDDTCDYLLYWDYDNGMTPETLGYFMEDMGNPGVSIVTGLYFMKDKDFRVTSGMRFPHTPAGRWELECVSFLGGGLVNLSRDCGSVSGVVPAGMLMVRKEVFYKVPYPWFQTCWPDGVFNGEDTTFSVRAQEAGYDLYLDPRIKSAHMSGGTCFPPEWKPW